MQEIHLKWLAITAVLTVACINYAFADDSGTEHKTTRFSHRGVKAALGVGQLGTAEETQLEDGQAVTLNLGYGFSSHSTLWLAFTGSEHKGLQNKDLITEFDGAETTFQYKFRPESRLQPYGKLGFGVYGMKDLSQDTRQLGAGFVLALGTDFFFARHFGLGAELTFKDIKYYREQIQTLGGEVTNDLKPGINRDSFGFLITLTVQ